MVSIHVTAEFRPQRIERAVERAAARNLGHAAARIRKDAAASLRTAAGPSAPGQPPHTHRGAYLRRALRFAYDAQRQEAVVGPLASVVGDVGHAHEFGARRGGQDFPERPFMLPALESNIGSFAGSFEGSIGE
jgi:hypothetical protein